MIKGLPPGSILQLMYLKRRLSKLKPGFFIEIGPGAGDITNLLLQNGWHGISYDLDESTVHKLNTKFKAFVNTHSYQAINENFLDNQHNHPQVDLFISCMVIEHLDASEQAIYFEKCYKLMAHDGVLINIVPANKNAWGIEDEIAGHYRRYNFQDLSVIATNHNYSIAHLAALTYPISNLLLPLSNFLVRRKEGKYKTLDMQSKTKLSGRRGVKFKTHFPNIFNVILNEVSLYPLYLLQILFNKTSHALVVYSEFTKNSLND